MKLQSHSLQELTTELLHFMEDKQNLICVPFSALNYLSEKRLFSEIVHIMDSKSAMFSSKLETSVLTIIFDTAMKDLQFL